MDIRGKGIVVGGRRKPKRSCVFSFKQDFLALR
jgi:hypothetical protein